MNRIEVRTAAAPGGPMPWKQHAAAMLTLGLPLIGAQLAQLSIGVTDTIMIGWLGARQLAAGVLGSQAFFIALMLGAGFAFAIVPLVAQAQGRGDNSGVRGSAHMGLWIVALFAAFMMGPMWMLESVLVALGQEPDIAAMAASYSRIMQWSLFPALLTMALRSYLSALERTRIVLAATILAAVMNAILNYAFIFGHFGAPRLELQGSAIASLLSSLLSFGILVAYSMLSPLVRKHGLHTGLLKPDWPAFLTVLRLGWPISVTIIAEVGLFAASSLMMGWLGTIELAAHGIALQLASLAFMIPLGLASAVTIRIGRAHGRREHENVRRAAIVAIALAAGVAVCGALLFVAFPRALAGLFLEETNADAAEVANFAAVLLLVAAAFQLVDGLQAVASGLLRGVRDTTVPMLMAVFSYWVAGLPAAYFLGFSAGFGGVGIWAGLAAGLALAALLLTARFFRLTGGASTKL